MVKVDKRVSKRLRARLRRIENSISIPVEIIQTGDEYDICADIAEKELRTQHLEIDIVEIEDITHLRFQKKTSKRK
jgi:hypothetical protein